MILVLQFEQPVVETPALQELPMVSLLLDLPLVQDHDSIAALDRGQTVSHYQSGSILHQLGQSLLDTDLGFGIHRRCRSGY